MKRKNHLYFVAVSDTHFRSTCPICREETSNKEFIQTQIEKWNQVVAVAKKYNAPILHAGDLFHSPNSPYYLLEDVYLNLPRETFIVKGNHDSIQGGTERSAFDLLQVVRDIGKDQVSNAWKRQNPLVQIDDGLYEKELPSNMLLIPLICKSVSIKILLVHSLILKKKDVLNRHLKKGKYNESLITKVAKQYEFVPDILITGDNHKSFSEVVPFKKKKIYCINPGCMTRQRANEASYIPTFYLVDISLNLAQSHFSIDIIPHPFRLDYGINTERQLMKKQQAKKMNAFVESLDDDPDYSLNFIQNIRTFLKENRQDPRLKKIIYEVLREESENVE